MNLYSVALTTKADKFPALALVACFLFTSSDWSIYHSISFNIHQLRLLPLEDDSGLKILPRKLLKNDVNVLNYKLKIAS